MVMVQPPSFPFQINGLQLSPVSRHPQLGNIWEQLGRGRQIQKFELSPGYGNFTPRAGPTRASHSPDDIEKYAFVVVLQIGQVVGEVGEVVADASLQVLANMTIDRGQRAAAALTYIR